MASSFQQRRNIRFRRFNRRGQVLVEFAIISLMLTFAIAGLLGIIVLALGSFQNNIATESAGRELDGHHVLIEQNFREHFNDPMDPDHIPDGQDFEDVSARQVYRFLNEYAIDGSVDGPVLYDESRLILSLADWGNRENLDLPAINQSLLGQYIFDPDIEIDGQVEQGAYRFPGAVVTNQNVDPPTRTVVIPILPGPNGASGIGRTFHVKSTDSQLFYPVSQDWVAPVVIGKEQDGDGFEFRIIMFHPSQPASTITIERQFDAQGRLETQTPVVADDSAVDAAIGDPPVGYVLTPPTAFNPQFGASPSRGEFGLGESLAFATKVRPFRAVFETSSLFRMGTSLNPIAVKYEADESAIPFPALVDQAADTHTTDSPVAPFVAYEDNDDQSLDFEVRVVDRFSVELRRYLADLPIDPPASPDNDFVNNVLELLPNDDGVWRVRVSAEFSPDITGWSEGHVIQLRLYQNGVYQRLIAAHELTAFQSDPVRHTNPISLMGETVIEAVSGDVLQVRVFTDEDGSPGGTPTYSVNLTGTPQNNWVSFERVGN